MGGNAKWWPKTDWWSLLKWKSNGELLSNKQVQFLFGMTKKFWKWREVIVVQ